jgi:hypothetical protein
MVKRHGQALHQDIFSVNESGDLLLPCPAGKVVLSMQLKLLVLGVVAPFAICGPALALDAWAMTTERGLPVATVGSAEGTLRVICDPDRVFGPTSNAAIAAQLGGDDNPNMIVFLARSGEQARLQVTNGVAPQATTEAAEWAKMVAILRAGGEFAVVTSLDSVTFETPAFPELDCD